MSNLLVSELAAEVLQVNDPTYTTVDVSSIGVEVLQVNGAGDTPLRISNVGAEVLQVNGAGDTGLRLSNIGAEVLQTNVITAEPNLRVSNVGAEVLQESPVTAQQNLRISMVSAEVLQTNAATTTGLYVTGVGAEILMSVSELPPWPPAGGTVDLEHMLDVGFNVHLSRLLLGNPSPTGRQLLRVHMGPRRTRTFLRLKTAGVSTLRDWIRGGYSKRQGTTLMTLLGH